MKKYITIFFLLAFAKGAQSQIITDTTGYLRDSIQAKANYYVGKSLNVLLNDLKLEVKSYLPPVPTPELPDTIGLTRTWLRFTDFNTAMQSTFRKQKKYEIEITFSSPILIPKEQFKEGQFFGSTIWTVPIADFFSTHTLSGLRVIGL